MKINSYGSWPLLSQSRVLAMALLASVPSGLFFGQTYADTSGVDMQSQPTQQTIQTRIKKELVVDGLRFRDLNGDGALNPYEDWRLSPQDRAGDLVARMTLPEKAGAMMHASLVNKSAEGHWAGSDYDYDHFGAALSERHISSFITRLAITPAMMAEKHNRLQELAEDTRLGIPVTISTDPRNHFQYVLGASAESIGFSQWPEPLGFAALGDPAVVQQFGDIVRQEYRSVGIHMALSPQADLATEPRWPRQVATFGSRPVPVSDLAAAYVKGFQGSASGVTEDGVLTVTKHWVGYGAAVDGFDGHNYYGRFARLDGNTLDAHIAAFTGPLAVHSGGIMPTYPILQGATLDGEPLEQVGAGFSHQLLTQLLREKLGYQGIILSDWGITRDCGPRCMSPTAKEPQDIPSIATPWGVESLSAYERYVKGVRAGLDQFGGVEEPGHLVEAVTRGDLTEARLDQSVKRIMQAKFELGLFDNPYVDPAVAGRVVGSGEFLAAGERTQRQAQVLLENKGGFLPVNSLQKNGGQIKVFLYGIAPTAAQVVGLTVVENPADADFAIIRASTPSELLHPNHFFGSRQNEGRLDFREGDEAFEALKMASARVPTVFAIFLDRPAILGNIRDKATAILGNFGASDEAVLDVLLGKEKPKGKLPFELPSSMQAVREQHPAVADDTGEPLYQYGYGLELK